MLWGAAAIAAADCNGVILYGTQHEPSSGKLATAG